MFASVVSLVCGLALCYGGDTRPRTLRDHVQPEVGYVHSAIPFEVGLSRAELNRWIALINATDAQATAIRSLYDTFLTDQYNPFVDRAAPDYLLKAAAASSALQSAGMTSSEFRAAWRHVDRNARSLMNMSAIMEQQLLTAIEGIDPALDSDQLDTLQVLRGSTSRRHARFVSSSNRWVRFELRDVWDAGLFDLLTDADHVSVGSKLAGYEFELTGLVDQWSRSHLHATRRVQDYFYDLAIGRVGAGRSGPEQIWARPASIIKRLRALHSRANDDILGAIDESVRAEASRRVAAAMYPELYPDLEYEEVIAAFAAAVSKPGAPPDALALALNLRDLFDEQYGKLSRRLESACDEWDDQIASGVAAARSQDRVGALTPLLDDRRKLHQEFLQRLRSEAAMQEP